jgi:hypothetical protein
MTPVRKGIIPQYHGYKAAIPIIQGVAYGSGTLPDGRMYDTEGNIIGGGAVPGSAADTDYIDGRDVIGELNRQEQEKEDEQRRLEEEERLRKFKTGATLYSLSGALAMGVGYYRTRSLWKSALLGFVSLPYLIYVGIDELGKKKS